VMLPDGNPHHVQIRAKDEAGMGAVMTALGSREALKNKLDGALKERGLKPSTGVSPPVASAASGSSPMWALALAACLSSAVPAVFRNT